MIFSIKKVHSELTDGKKDDLVRQWVDKQLPESFFLPDKNDSATMNAYVHVMNWAATSAHYTQQAKDKFAMANKADAFLVASSVAHGYQIVTQEKSNPEQKSDIKLPDAANNFGVKTCFIYDFLSQHATGNFNFKI